MCQRYMTRIKFRHVTLIWRRNYRQEGPKNLTLTVNWTISHPLCTLRMRESKEELAVLPLKSYKWYMYTERISSNDSNDSNAYETISFSFGRILFLLLALRVNLFISWWRELISVRQQCAVWKTYNCKEHKCSSYISNSQYLISGLCIYWFTRVSSHHSPCQYLNGVCVSSSLSAWYFIANNHTYFKFRKCSWRLFNGFCSLLYRDRLFRVFPTSDA